MSDLLFMPEVLVREAPISSPTAHNPIAALDVFSDPTLPAAVTKAASSQTYSTIRYLVDQPLVQDAYRAYAYFRWVDDMLDELLPTQNERLAFLQRQQTLINCCYAGEICDPIYTNEQMLIDLIGNHPQRSGGLKLYIHHMMAVMAFDTTRRGRLVSQRELNAYTNHLSIAVTEALHFFIGHNKACPQTPARYAAVKGAHIAHMLRDAIDDATAGYINIPGEVLAADHIDPSDIHHPAYMAWVKQRTELARSYLQSGKHYLEQVKHLRCRLAGYAYTARFEVVLNMIEKDGYRLRADYSARKSLRSGLWMARSTVSNLCYDFVRGLL